MFPATITYLCPCLTFSNMASVSLRYLYRGSQIIDSDMSLTQMSKKISILKLEQMVTQILFI